MKLLQPGDSLVLSTKVFLLRSFSIKLKDRIDCRTGAASILPIWNIGSVLTALKVSKYKLANTRYDCMSRVLPLPHM